MLDKLFPQITPLSGLIAQPPIFPFGFGNKDEDPEKKLQAKIDAMTDFDNDFVDESYLKKLVKKLGKQSITIVSLSHTKDYQVVFCTQDSLHATVTTKNKFSRDLYVGQKITAS